MLSRLAWLENIIHWQKERRQNTPFSGINEIWIKHFQNLEIKKYYQLELAERY